MKNQLALTKTESTRLAELETRIAAGIQTFQEIGAALIEVRDSRLYRAMHGTFEDYCREKWAMTDRHARNLIAASSAASNVSQTGTVVPKTESQARPLTKLPAEQQPAAWARAVESAGGAQPTAKQVAAVVEEVLTGEDDERGVPLSPETRRQNQIEADRDKLTMIKSSYSRNIRRWLATLPVDLRREFFVWVAAQAPK